MSECIVPSWNLSHQRQQVAGEEGNRSSSHVHDQPHLGYVVPMSNYEVAELTWENGQLAMQGLAGILPPAPAARSPTFGRSGDTLETIVHQATGYNKHEEKNLKELQETTEQAPIINPITAATSGRKRVENMQISAGFVQKRARLSASDHQSGRYSNIGSSSRSVRSLHEDQQVAERGGCASASATFYREKDATTMTWASFESPPGSFKTSKTTDEDSACHGGSENRDEELETKGETARSHPERRSRAALMHNQSERRRRDRINQKMKALQKLVPNASKTDKASMLDEVIEYLKQLQAQVHMMSTRSIPQMMMNPLAMQQQLQMALLSRMGMGVGLGMGMSMLDINSLSRTTSHPLQPGLISTVPVPAATPTFLPPHLALPAAALGACSPAQVKSPVEVTNNPASVRFADPYSVFLAQQAMNMDIYKMAALYRQQACKATEATSNPSQTNFTQRE